MAYYAALVSVLEFLEKIISRKQYPKFLLGKKQIKPIHEKLSHLQALLEDYFPENEATADSLERRIRDAAYQVQDILDEQSEKCREGKTHRVKTVLHRLLIYKLKREFPRQLQDMEKVKEEVDSIVEEMTRLKITKSHTTEDLGPISYYPASKQESISCGDTMVGFEEQLIAIKHQLCGESSKLEVVPLVGMGGIGKTTLCRSIFGDGLVVYHFDCRGWVTVSQDYHLQKVSVDILESLKVDINTSGVDEGLLAESIYKYLKGRRYLIIMDDVWDTKVWDDMKRIFPDDNNGSRLILTTRLSNVASYANKWGSFHQMQFLNEDQSWNLLRNKVFAQEDCPRELEDIGRSIAKSCRGLPLAIVVVAGFLCKVNQARDDWEAIARTVSSKATKNDENLLKILSLSYNHLPHHLKPCFLYMGGFPEDYQIPVSQLIKLWVVEGFLRQDELKSLEEMGEEYLEDLVKRNLVLVTKKNPLGKFKCCSIHDVLREMCVKRAQNESFLHVVDGDVDYLFTKGTMNIIRRLYIHPGLYIHPDRSRIVKVEEFGLHVGSILCFHDNEKLLSFPFNFKRLRVLDEKLLSFPFNFKRLRVLDALSVEFYTFPIEVLKLSRLRYLALGKDFEAPVLEIPSRIVKLENLQTIVIQTRTLGHLTKSSFEIWKMPNLRHVTIGELQLPLPHRFAHVLKNLQTLSGVVNFRLTKRVIQMIPNLQKLKVECRMDDVIWEEVSEIDKPYGIWGIFCLYNLAQLCHLEVLAINLYFELELLNPSFPEKFAFPQKLKKLTLSYCKIPWKDMTVVGSLPHLQVLKLKSDAFVGDEWEPVEGEFPQLKFLLMQSLNLKYWRAEATHFPRLGHLQIRNCEELEEIPCEIGDIPSLELIEVSYSTSAGYSALQIKEEQQNLGNDALQVLVNFSAYRVSRESTDEGQAFLFRRRNFGKHVRTGCMIV